MDTLQWSERFATGIDAIDQEHKKLVELLAMIQESKDTCLDKDKTDKIFDELFQFAENHFALEEKLMADSAFPFASSHKRDHLFFTKTLSNWQEDRSIDCKSKKISSFLTEWLFEHILHHDMKMKEYMQAAQA